jgi:ubiquinone/menaquinone biosynthesis C-methylase UbiE
MRQELYATILAALGPHNDVVVDIACGSGQATVTLAGRFTHVHGVDGNAAQLAAAPRHHPNISWHHADAHATGLPDACADLVTCAQALHW